MANRSQKFIVILTLLASSMAVNGCAMREAAKKVIGTSTQTLEEESRINAVSRTFRCSYKDCFDAIMTMARAKESNKPWEHVPEPNTGEFDVIMSDLYSNPPHIIVVGVKGNIDTTEVGIFLNRTSREAIRVDVSSLSSIAKQKIADLIFQRLSLEFEQDN